MIGLSRENDTQITLNDDVKEFIRSEINTQLSNLVETEVQAQLENKVVRFPDYTNVIKTIEGQNQSWTATEDCAVRCIVKCDGDGYSAIVKVDGKDVYGDWVANSANSMADIFFVKKGQTITTRADHGTYNLTVFGLTQ